MTDLLTAFIETAESHLGYTARANGNFFGERVGYNGMDIPWDGSFIDVVARDSGVQMPAHIYSPVALGHYISNGRLYLKPRRGDIVFFELPVDGLFTQPHVGIVTNVTAWKEHGTFETIEANTASGTAKGAQAHDGVHRRIRNSFEVIGFGRPAFKAARVKSVAENLTVIKPAQVKPGIRHKNVELVQLALSAMTGVSGLPKGFFDGKTRAAYAKFQRSIGFREGTGHPDLASLQRLGKETGFFTAVE
jgi:hypothetical protein